MLSVSRHVGYELGCGAPKKSRERGTEEGGVNAWEAAGCSGVNAVEFFASQLDASE